LKDDLIKDFGRLEEKVGLGQGDITRSGILPIPSSAQLQQQSGRRRQQAQQKNNELDGLVDFANQTKRRQSTAMDAERQRQDEIFKQRLAERRKNRV
jgi:hypothetical protein